MDAATLAQLNALRATMGLPPIADVSSETTAPAAMGALNPAGVPAPQAPGMMGPPAQNSNLGRRIPPESMRALASLGRKLY